MIAISELERWYASHCDGLWEHGYGVKIDTLDNPGWSVTINLKGTRKESATLETQKAERSENDWIHSWIEKGDYHIACGPLNLTEAIHMFVHWFDS